MYRICVCDDDPIFLSHFKDMTDKFFSDRISVQISTFSAPEELMNSDTVYDLYFLDIYMPGITGFEIARKLREGNLHVAIIFISSLTEPVFESFQYHPLRYIRKELLDQELPEALQTFHLLYEDKINSFSLTVNGIQKFILFSDLLYCETKGHYILFHCKDNEYQIRGKLSDYFSDQKHYFLAQPSKSFLVNMTHISFFSNQRIVMEDGTILSVTRNYKESFAAAFMKYQRIYHYDNTLQSL